ncbi:peptidase M23, partial [Pseudomonas sp.]|uniref:murein hydrolase activator EnvC family protein n=1 Tax=Pseudomonas sp. TaxID=306 RepID=UPI0028ABF57C
MLRALLPLALSCLLSPAFADERAQTQQQLDATRKDIAELQKVLGQVQAQKAGVQKDLQTTETEIGTLEKQVEALQQQLKKTEGELERLDKEKKKLQSARVEQQRLIAIQARSAYQNGREEYLKLLLNQQNPEKFARTLTYYDYLSQARLEQLRTFNETLRQLAGVEQDISRQQAQLLAQRGNLDSRKHELEAVRSERQQVLAKINADLKQRNQALQTRQQDQADLAQVLKTIEETLARQAREAEEARQKALLAQQEAEKRRQQEALARAEAEKARGATRPDPEPVEEAPVRPRQPLGPVVSSDGANYGGAF